MSAKKKENTISVLDFLDVYEKYQNLWDPNLESYKNKSARDDAYNAIITELNLPNLSINDVKLKVKSIRTTYKKELRLLRQNQSYNPKLFWFNRANSFLKDVSMTRQKRTNSTEKPSSEYKQCNLEYINTSKRNTMPALLKPDMPSNIEDINNSTSSVCEYKTQRSAELEARISENISEDDEGVEEELSTKYSTHAPENYHVQSASNVISMPTVTSSYLVSTKCGVLQNSDTTSTLASTTNATGNGVNIAEQSAIPLEVPTNSGSVHMGDDYDYFCRSVAAQLRSIGDNYSRSVAKLKIQQILFEAETGHYRNNPCITIPVSQTMNNL